jgi:hypothetical protein
MLKVIDSFNSRDFVDLDESEMESIQGGFCREGFSFYPAGSIVKRDDGNYYKCIDKPAWKGGDVWRVWTPESTEGFGSR